jgi:DNA-binding NarL/FixJ family response regulator
MRILLADDHALVRCVYRRILEKEFHEAEFGEAENSQRAMDAMLEESWDLVILDIYMPGCGGLDVLTKIRAQRPGIQILIVSMHAQQSFVFRALRSGASGYLDKASTSGELIKAVGCVLEGRRYLGQALAEQWAAALGCPEADVLEGKLSNREFDVLRKIATGTSVVKIAHEMRLSSNAVGTYRSRIFKKMQMLTNTDLMLYAIQNRLVVSDPECSRANA